MVFGVQESWFYIDQMTFSENYYCNYHSFWKPIIKLPGVFVIFMYRNCKTWCKIEQLRSQLCKLPGVFDVFIYKNNKNRGNSEELRSQLFKLPGVLVFSFEKNAKPEVILNTCFRNFSNYLVFLHVSLMKTSKTLCFWSSVFKNIGNCNGYFRKCAYLLCKTITFGDQKSQQSNSRIFSPLM